jgi:hypothetical protein
MFGPMRWIGLPKKFAMGIHVFQRTQFGTFGLNRGRNQVILEGDFHGN